MKRLHLTIVFLIMSLTTISAQANELHDAVQAGDKVKVERLLSKGADINVKIDTGATPLSMAVLYDQKEISNLLVAKGADVNAKDNSGVTPLAVAAAKGNKETVNLFITKGADVNTNSQWVRHLCTARQYLATKKWPSFSSRKVLM